jgi:cystathionine beta-lyase family protein involved in aluminum resistance
LFEYNEEFWQLAGVAEAESVEQIKMFDAILEVNQRKVLEAFVKHRVSSSHLVGTTGYGYGDCGRAVIDKIYADVFNVEAALVRHNFVSGTHALAVCLFGVLRPGEKMVCVTGKLYDSLEKVVRGVGNGSLSDFGINYAEVNFLEEPRPHESLKRECENARLIYIQRSCGYSQRASVGVVQTNRIIEEVRRLNNDAVIVVDNCYCEFVEQEEPSGADLIVGSLIKNPGGGLVRTGGYIAGRKELVALCANRLTAPGLGADVGCSLDQNREILMGLFLAPQAVANALKTAIFCALLFEKLGFKVSPNGWEPRADIVQRITLGSKEALKAFCCGVQAASPIDSFVAPEEWHMPGYEQKIIMAAGNFTMGATLEASADAPMQVPYNAYYQGGLTFYAGKLCVMEAAWRVILAERAKEFLL